MQTYCPTVGQSASSQTADNIATNRRNLLAACQLNWQTYNAQPAESNADKTRMQAPLTSCRCRLVALTSATLYSGRSATLHRQVTTQLLRQRKACPSGMQLFQVLKGSSQIAVQKMRQGPSLHMLWGNKYSSANSPFLCNLIYTPQHCPLPRVPFSGSLMLSLTRITR